MTNVALIPARAGSKRLAGKNLRELGGKPLFQWTVSAALRSGCYDRIILATDHPSVHSWPQTTTGRTGDIELMVFVREIVPDMQPDIEWVLQIQAAGLLGGAETFSILRPTSPFRSADTIRRAWKIWEACNANDYYDSLRTMRLVSEHPSKMWIAGSVARPFHWPEDDREDGIQPWNSPTQSLPAYCIQTAGLEIARRRVLPHSISGVNVCPLILEGPEALDINSIEDWWVAERYVAEGLVT